jgi:hypothetical protein
MKSRKNIRIFTGMLLAGILVMMAAWPVYASGIDDTTLATGTQKLLEDVTGWLLIIAPVITVVAVIIFFIRRGISDEMDHKRWSNRITTAIISCVCVVTASVVIRVILSYYN